MKKPLKTAAAVALALALVNLTAFASGIRFVNVQDNERPAFSFFGLFKKKEAALAPVGAKDGRLTVTDGTLVVGKNRSAAGTFNVKSTASALKFEVSNRPEHGTVSVESGNAFVYTPDKDYLGADSFEFTAAAGGETAKGKVFIEVEEPEPSPEPSPSPSFRYEDMLNHWGAVSAIALAKDNILQGDNINGKFYFYPERELTRGDFILYLVSALGLNVEEYAQVPNPFADADQIPAWLNLQAKAAYDAGIIKGSAEYGKLYLYPDNKLSRVEAASMLHNIIRPNTVSYGNSRYTDNYLVPDWAKDVVSNMTDYGIVNGFEDNTFRPFVKITRAMGAQMLNQTMKYTAQHPEVVENIKNQMDKNMYY